MTQLLGQQLGNYRLTQLLGEGGFAEVYLGEHIHLNTQAAVKVLNTRLVEEDSESFLNEARIIARLEHPHIVRILDYGIEDDAPYLVMSYAPHGTLRQRHPKGARLALTTVIGYIDQVADAIQYAHDERLIHRDIKPENMLLGRRNEILLSDFGIAVVAHSSRSQNMQDAIGTAAYIAPEQLQGRPYPGSDQYALGVVVYEWLCGELPFKGSFAELCSQHMHAPPPPLRLHTPSIPPATEQVVLTTLAKNPQQRFANMRLFAEALRKSEQRSAGHPQKMPLWTLDAQSRSEIGTIPTEHFNPLSAARIQSPSDDKAVRTPFPATPSFPDRAGVDAKSSQTFTRYNPSRRKFLGCLFGLGAVGVASAGVVRYNGAIRTWGSQLLRAFFATYTYHGHSAPVNALAWSLDGKRIASASDDETVQVWDAVSGNHVFTYRGHSDAVKAVAWSPDGMYIASGSTGNDRTVQIWDAASVRHLYTYNHASNINALAWSPKSHHIASANDDQTVEVWHAITGTHLFTYRGHMDIVNDVAWSPNGDYIASASNDNTVQIWDAATGSRLVTYTGHPRPVNAVAWSFDSAFIASGSSDATVQVWELDTKSTIRPRTYPGHASPVRAVAWSPNGKRITSGSGDTANYNLVTDGNGDHTMQVWDAATGANAFSYRGHSDTILSVAWSPSGIYVASGSYDHTVQVWQVI